MEEDDLVQVIMQFPLLYIYIYIYLYSIAMFIRKWTATTTITTSTGSVRWGSNVDDRTVTSLLVPTYLFHQYIVGCSHYQTTFNHILTMNISSSKPPTFSMWAQTTKQQLLGIAKKTTYQHFKCVMTKPQKPKLKPCKHV